MDFNASQLFFFFSISIDVKKNILTNEYIPLFIKIQCKSIQDAIQYGKKKKDETLIKHN